MTTGAKKTHHITSLFACCTKGSAAGQVFPAETKVEDIGEEVTDADEEPENPLRIEDEIPKLPPTVLKRNIDSRSDPDTENLKPEPRWFEHLYPPTNTHMQPEKVHQSLADLELQWVYGYQAYQSRNNVKYSRPMPDNSSCGSAGTRLVVFPAAGLGVVYNPSTHTQRFYRGHGNAKVTTLDMHPSGIIAASGEIGENGAIHVWHLGAEDRNSPTGLAILKMGIGPQVTQGVLSLSFSKDGEQIAATVINANNEILLWNWQTNAQPVARVSAFDDYVFGICFNPYQKREFTTYGVRHVRFWKIDGSGPSTYAVVNRGSNYARKCAPQTTFAACFLKNKMLATGTMNGSVLFWKGQSLQMYIHGAHKGSIYTMAAATKTPNLSLLTAGEDSRIVFWNNAGQPTSEITIDGNRKIRSLHCGAWIEASKSGLTTLSRGKSRFTLNRRKTTSSFTSKLKGDGDEKAVASTNEVTSPINEKDSKTELPQSSSRPPSTHSSKIMSPLSASSGSLTGPASSQLRVIVGCEDSTIWVVDPTQRTKSVLLPAHSAAGDAQLWGLAYHPREPWFLTAGEDTTARIWNVAQRRLIYKKILPEMRMRCCDWHPDGGCAAVGADDGSFAILSWDLSVVQSKTQHRKTPVHDVKYSPNGRYLAVASHDCAVDIYMVEAEAPVPWYQRISICQGHWSYVARVDWSPTSRFIRSNTADDEVLFFDTVTGNCQPPSGHIRDVAWATTTCPLSWEVHNLWASNEDYGLPGERTFTVAALSNDVLALGTEKGEIALANHPTCGSESPSQSHTGHSSPISNVRFSRFEKGKSSRLITTGSRDGCALQWELKGGDVGETSLSEKIEHA